MSKNFVTTFFNCVIVLINLLSEQLNHLDIVFEKLSEFEIHLTQSI